MPRKRMPHTLPLTSSPMRWTYAALRAWLNASTHLAIPSISHCSFIPRISIRALFMSLLRTRRGFRCYSLPLALFYRLPHHSCRRGAGQTAWHDIHSQRQLATFAFAPMQRYAYALPRHLPATHYRVPPPPRAPAVAAPPYTPYPRRLRAFPTRYPPWQAELRGTRTWQNAYLVAYAAPPLRHACRGLLLAIMLLPRAALLHAQRSRGGATF